MYYKIRNVAAMDDYFLIVQFTHGVTKKYDVKRLFRRYAWSQALREKNLFQSVTVDVGGYGIVWNDELDLSSEEIWENGTVIKTNFDGLLSFKEATTLWNLNESTLRKAVSYGKLKNGIDVQKFGKQWVVSLHAMVREYGPIDYIKI